MRFGVLLDKIIIFSLTELQILNKHFDWYLGIHVENGNW